VPSFTFVSTVNAFVLRGARPVFRRRPPRHTDLDERLLERLGDAAHQGDRARPYAGVGCEMDAILEIARPARDPVVEDNAHGLVWHLQRAGTSERSGCWPPRVSMRRRLHVRRGGRTADHDADLVERAEILREKGTNRSQFFRGQGQVTAGLTWARLSAIGSLAACSAAARGPRAGAGEAGPASGAVRRDPAPMG